MGEILVAFVIGWVVGLHFPVPKWMQALKDIFKK